MGDELNFCPMCGTQSHKMLLIKDNTFYCKECDSFFNTEPISMKCPKCETSKLKDSDFPAPDGSIVLQCQKCMKMFSMKDVLKFNDLEEQN